MAGPKGHKVGISLGPDPGQVTLGKGQLTGYNGVSEPGPEQSPPLGAANPPLGDESSPGGPGSHIQVVLPGEDAEGGEADDNEGGRRTGGPAKGSKLTAEEKENEKARLQRVVKDFAKDAVKGMEMTVIDLDGRKFRTLFQMDNYLQHFTLEPVKGEGEGESGDEVPEHMKKIEMKGIESVYRGTKIMKKNPAFPYPEDAPHCVGMETKPDRVKLFFLIPEEDARDKFYTCLKILSFGVAQLA
ncbi:unnamed protein product [Vitrella brassicaformis CCMP3155]|uniref:Uncharacterized protein n=1 Tax=Vitrella brassicaformis (strain CCMP3155) TaxID=1169540 RepID=A0A0G4F3G4_VITBC|nr:unnamed protein product [Vitrella brassicaformis CCMP3155]|eukprot:CEM06602.1 unnamed protein product [Vitrella brassicaformis CCMP3155]